MKRAALLFAMLALAGCGQQAVSAGTPQLASLVTPGHVESDIPPVTSGGPEQSWVEVSARSVTRPSTGGPCAAAAYLRTDNRVQINPVGCVTGEARVIVDDGAHQTSQTVGAWYLVVTQRAQGVEIAPPTFKVLSGGKQIWP